MSKNFYLTTPIYYVNDEPHIGHAYTTILADVLARYHKIYGENVFFLTGTDEHGQKLEEAAKKNGKGEKEYCDFIVKRFISAWERLNIEYSDFIRTTEERHTKIVKKILQDLYDKNEIYKDSYEGWYCVPCERFWTEKDLIDNKCPDCNREVRKVTEENYFFKLSKYQDWLIDYIEKNENFIKPSKRRNEILGNLKAGKLPDLCISRPKKRLSWGIELPFDNNYVTYVWFDALINYISAIGYGADEEKFKQNWPADYHLIGKDILFTHSVYWPIMLKAIGVELPKTILAHGWWLIDNTKMSKSRGNVVKPLDLSEKYGIDAFRYFLMRDMTLGMDSNFSEYDLVRRYNSDLANDYGNLISRVFNMIHKYFNGKLTAENIEWDENIKKAAENTVNNVHNLINELKLDIAIENILQFVRNINKYIEDNAPWKLIKTDIVKTSNILRTALEGIRITSYLLYPIMPKKIEYILSLLNIKIEMNKKYFEWGLINSEINLPVIEPIFPRVDMQNFEQDIQSEKEKNQESVENDNNLITIDDFKKINLVVAEILEVEKIENSDKLYKLIIDIGNEKRQLVAGIASNYTKEELLGKKVVVLKNLKPAEIKGVMSQGMLLAASKKKDLSIITVDKDIPNGSIIS